MQKATVVILVGMLSLIQAAVIPIIQLGGRRILPAYISPNRAPSGPRRYRQPGITGNVVVENRRGDVVDAYNPDVNSVGGFSGGLANGGVIALDNGFDGFSDGHLVSTGNGQAILVSDPYDNRDYYGHGDNNYLPTGSISGVNAGNVLIGY